MSQKNLVLDAFENLLVADKAGTLSPEMKAQVVQQAALYARRFKMPFDNTFLGAIRLAEEANRVVQDAAAEIEKAERADREAKRRLAGFRGTDLVKDLLVH